MNKLIIIILIVLWSICSFSQTNKIDKINTLTNAINKLKNDKSLKNAGISFTAIDVNSGEIIGSLNPDLALSPASTQKVITTATAIEVFGPKYKFLTTLEYTGTIDKQKKVLNGSIIIKGGGDPTLGSRYFNKTEQQTFIKTWINEIKNAGIDSISGGVVGDARWLSYDIVPPTWAWEDMGNYFGAGACGLSIYDNSYNLYFSTGNKVGDLTKITRVSPEGMYITFDNQITSDNINSDNSYIFGAPYNDFRYLRGELPLAKIEYEVTGSMPDPAYFAAMDFEKALQINGIKVNEKATTYRNSPTFEKSDSLQHTILYRSLSPSLLEIISVTNFRSNNMFAEHCVNHIGLELGKKGDTKTGANEVEKFWKAKGMDIEGMSLNDGSGLSRYNTITTKQMTFLLKYMKKESKYAEDFYSSLPIVGESGTVKSLCKGTFAEGNMHAKSGSIRAVRAYAGYVTTKSGREVAFSVILNNYNCTANQSMQKLEALLTVLAEYNE